MPYGIVWRVLDGQVSMRGKLALSPLDALPATASLAETPVMYLFLVVTKCFLGGKSGG